MEITREGITFDCYYVPGTRDTRYVMGDPAELVIEGHTITDRAAMVAEYGDKSVDDIIEQEYQSMLEQAEAKYFDNDDVGPEWDKYEYDGV